MSLYSLGKVAFPGLALVLASVLPVPAYSQASQAAAAEARPAMTVTLDPPTGLDLQAHTVDSKGNVLPEAPANFRRLGEATVGQPADLHTLTLRFSETTRVTGISVTRDFKVEQGGSCVEGNVYGKGSTCSLLARFTPQGPGNRLGKLTITSSSATPDAFGLGGFGYSPVISFIPAIISTVPGTYPSNVGLLSGAQNLTVDGGDNLYAGDTGNNAVRMLNSGGTWALVGNGTQPTAPFGVGVDSFGEVYVSAGNAIYETFAYPYFWFQVSGSGNDACHYPSSCTLDISGSSTSGEEVSKPGSITFDQNNNFYFEEDTNGAAMSQSLATSGSLPLTRLYDPFTYQSGKPTAFAYSGGYLYSWWPTSCQINSQSLYNVEQFYPVFSKVAGGRICGFSGDGGLAGSAEISNTPGQIAFDSAGDLYYADSGNQRVRRIDYSTGIIRTIAGNGTAGYYGDNGGALGAALSSPTGVAVDSQGQVYIISSDAATGTSQVIRKLEATGISHFGSRSKGTHSAAAIVQVTNTGNISMQLTNAGFTGTNPGDFSIDPLSTSCVLTAGATLSTGQTCQIGFIFTPSGVGTRSANFVMLNNTASNSNTIFLTGTGTLPTAGFTITSPSNGATFTSGTAVTFSAKVTSSSGPAPTGTVQFGVDGANYGSPVTISSGAASTSVTGLTVKSHTLSATYSGDSNYATGGPISVTITVTSSGTVRQPTVVMSPVTKTDMSCVPQTFNVGVVSASGITPTGAVQLLDGSRGVSSATLVNGKAVLSSPPLAAGTHSFTTQYEGDAHNLPAVSAAQVVTVSQAGGCNEPVDRVSVR